MFTYKLKVEVKAYNENNRPEILNKKKSIRFALPPDRLVGNLKSNVAAKPVVRLPKHITGSQVRPGEKVVIIQPSKGEVIVQSKLPVDSWTGYTWILKKKKGCNCGTYQFKFNLLKILS